MTVCDGPGYYSVCMICFGTVEMGVSVFVYVRFDMFFHTRGVLFRSQAYVFIWE